MVLAFAACKLYIKGLAEKRQSLRAGRESGKISSHSIRQATSAPDFGRTFGVDHEWVQVEVM